MKLVTMIAICKMQGGSPMIMDFHGYLHMGCYKDRTLGLYQIIGTPEQIAAISNQVGVVQIMYFTRNSEKSEETLFEKSKLKISKTSETKLNTTLLSKSETSIKANATVAETLDRCKNLFGIKPELFASDFLNDEFVEADPIEEPKEEDSL